MQAQIKNIKEKSTAICHIASIFDAEIFYLRQVLPTKLHWWINEYYNIKGATAGSDSYKTVKCSQTLKKFFLFPLSGVIITYFTGFVKYCSKSFHIHLFHFLSKAVVKGECEIWALTFRLCTNNFCQEKYYIRLL